MMDRDARLDEIFRRAVVVRRKHEADRARLLDCATAALALALITMIGALSGRGAEVHGTALGAFLLGPEAGGYVIVALIAFGLGIAVTLVTQKYTRAGRAMSPTSSHPRANGEQTHRVHGDNTSTPSHEPERR